MKIMTGSLFMTLVILYFLPGLLTGCIPGDPSNTPPIIITDSTGTLDINYVETTLNGTTKGDSIISTLWVCEDSVGLDDVYIENPDSLVTKVFIKKTGVWHFTLWVQDINNLMDSSQTTVTVL